jgi:SAM-dependent methyltransferase
MGRREPTLQTTTLWEFPSQHYGGVEQGSKDYRGATPSWVIWNLLQRYTKPKDLVVDPMCGSGTTLDVARDTGRRALGYDLQPQREDVFRADARKLPVEDQKVDFVFIDPPYGDNLKYSGKAECIGELAATDPAYFEAMNAVFQEVDRVLRPDRYLAVYVCDVWKRNAFVPLGAHLSQLLATRFLPVDHIAVVRGNKDLEKGNYHKAAEETGFFLRGFNHLLVFWKPPVEAQKPPPRQRAELIDAPVKRKRNRARGGPAAGGGKRPYQAQPKPRKRTHES